MSDLTQTTIQDEESKPQGIRWGMIALWGAVFTLLALLGWGLVRTNATRPEAGASCSGF